MHMAEFASCSLTEVSRLEYARKLKPVDCCSSQVRCLLFAPHYALNYKFSNALSVQQFQKCVIRSNRYSRVSFLPAKPPLPASDRVLI
jgi:hypothetical protein